jgi:RNA polymerase sigma factor for flagellar operon FliA
MSREELEALFLANLQHIDRTIDGLSRRYTLSRDASNEFGAWAKLRLIEDDYAVVAKFRGEASIRTYLTVVIAMMFREYRVQEWGRWRPSAAARRAGSLGVWLDMLINRDGLSLAQAGQIVRTAGGTNLSDRELGKIAATFPMRTPLRPVQAMDLPLDTADSARSDDLVDAETAASELAATRHALKEALEQLPDDDRLIIRLHYFESMSVAEIARALALPQKPLYRRLDRLLATLRGNPTITWTGDVV